MQQSLLSKPETEFKIELRQKKDLYNTICAMINFSNKLEGAQPGLIPILPLEDKVDTVVRWGGGMVVVILRQAKKLNL